MPKLTDVFLTTFAPEPGKPDRLAFDTACSGLGVRATKAGAKVFLCQWTDRISGRKRREVIGQWGSITIAQAREAVAIIKGDAAKGIDARAVRLAGREKTAAERRETKLTLGALVDDWQALRLKSRRDRYRSEAARAIKVAFADHLKKPAARLTRAEARDVLDAMVKRGAGAMALRTLAYGRACYGWAVKTERVPANPFAGLPVEASTEARERVLTDDEIGRVWNAVAAMGEPWGPYFRLLMLTLVRREELAQMAWPEISEDGCTWEIAGPRMKAGQAHVVALVPAAREALTKVTKVRGQPLVFSTTGKTAISGFTKAKAALDAASGVKDWRLHDLRRTGVTVLARMGVDAIVADKLLAHQPGKLSAVARVYQRHSFADERKAALEKWAEHIAAVAGDGGAGAKLPDNVVRFQRAGG